MSHISPKVIFVEVLYSTSTQRWNIEVRLFPAEALNEKLSRPLRVTQLRCCLSAASEALALCASRCNQLLTGMTFGLCCGVGQDFAYQQHWD